MIIKTLILFCLFSIVTTNVSFAFHGDNPDRMWGIMKNYARYDKTRIHKTKVAVQSYGDQTKLASGGKIGNRYDEFFEDKFNLAAIVLKGGKIVYERYNQEKEITADTVLDGMSIAKSGAASVIGHLLCDKKIKSLADTAGLYSDFLKTTPYANITIKNILLMSSGVSKKGDGEGRFIATALGFGKLAGKGSVKNALNLLEEANTSQGERFNYHPSDPLALSILAQEITGKPLGQLFYENIYLDFRKEGRLHWLSDNEGVTVPISSSAMRARDWAYFGQYIMQQMSANTCLGKFFKYGLENAVSTAYSDPKSAKFGFMSWVQDINGSPALTFRGHAGQLIAMDPTRSIVVYIASFDKNYDFGNIFRGRDMDEFLNK